ncbi:shikimate dehydrogenase [Desulforamulus hydrothermalis]|uniref:Shikimate dehydrogenase (NADP(+)) n=1 Tax=Desulforamulus hydrothermalis Lam5 = DSM 18033 TaxID=1121428 RepID=K8EB56_9FIRM|nr:shikimate dehydrogenase [Desulforamulus hydrothermalis]CCO08863.1 Shikimate dehydrogenase [Desulforamulus hydrothermalis Lam5 = DSM 18033]SHG73492.1 shikimate dehydrogenase [Desulforamulus hydrothermalis Lam5 = DSM 18033]
MGLPEINGKTKVCGLFGWPVEHSFSPAMHNAAYAGLGLNWVYVPYSVPPNCLRQAVEGMRALGLAGANVTVPHKQSIIPLLDKVDTAARIMGAVNTVRLEQGKLVGYNTDGPGFIQFLAAEANFSPQGKRVLLVGAGGAARAVAVALAGAGAAAIYITNRTPEKAEQLARDVAQAGQLTTRVLPWGRQLPGTVVAEVDLVIQTTPLGMGARSDQVPEFPFTALQPGQLVCDLIYNPNRTLFLQMAAARGATVFNGLGMLLYQGVLAFELWTGLPAPVAIMREALLKQVSGGEER